MRAKIIEERWPRWYFFGGTDVFDGDDDVLVGLPREKAEKAIAARNAFVDAMVEILLDEHPDRAPWRGPR